MTYILSKKTKPKLVDNNLLSQIIQNNEKQKIICANNKEDKFQLLLICIQNKIIDFLTNYFWIIIIIIIIIYILWCRYKWYKKDLENNNILQQKNIINYNHYIKNKQYTNPSNNYINENIKNFYNQKYINDKKFNNQKYINDKKSNNQNYINHINFDNINENNINEGIKYDDLIEYNNLNYIDEDIKYNNINDDQKYKNNLDIINTEYTNKKDIKYNNSDYKAVNFDIINNILFDTYSENNNYSFI
jgi:hypothetical protein